MRHVVIVGGGFAGLWGAMGAARQIEGAGEAGAGIRITLISRDRWLVIRPRLHEAHPSERMRVSLRAVLDPIEVALLEASVDAIDVGGRTVRARRADRSEVTLPYDRLVLAAGSRLHRPPVPGLEAHALSVDTYDDALALERHLLALPATPPGPERYAAVVVGAGFTGVEVAAELVGRLTEIAGAAERPRVTLVERADVLGPDLGARPRPVIEEALDALGVERRLGVTVNVIDAGGVTLSSGERLAARTVVWTAGLRASPLTALIPAALDALGRLVVDQTLRVPGAPGVFAAGDVAAAPVDGEHTTLISCQHAITLGVFAGHNVVRDLAGLPLLPYAPLPYQTCLDLGAWGALYTRGWDRGPVHTKAEGKAMKQTINTRWIYPPTTGNRADVLAVAVPGAYRANR
ncbi:MAG TPA: FAD-dependent oxidoreductase [Candidatus Acidoferrum sp.]|nr:FAD-dependent oxidoreductase [Candidatus Acidoferrum sp.]